LDSVPAAIREPRERDAVLVIVCVSVGRHELGARLIVDGVSENSVAF